MLSVAKIANTETITAAALVTTPAVSAMPRSTASRVGQAAVDVLADPAEHEDVVVHRQPDQHDQHEQRQPVDHEAGAGEVEQPTPPAVLEDQRHHPERGADRGQVEHRRDERERDAAERRTPSSATSAAARSRSPAAAGRPAAPRSPGTPRRRRRRRTPRRRRRAPPAPGRRAARAARRRPAGRTRRTACRARASTSSRPRTISTPRPEAHEVAGRDRLVGQVVETRPPTCSGRTRRRTARRPAPRRPRRPGSSR